MCGRIKNKLVRCVVFTTIRSNGVVAHTSNEYEYEYFIYPIMGPIKGIYNITIKLNIVSNKNRYKKTK